MYIVQLPLDIVYLILPLRQRDALDFFAALVYNPRNVVLFQGILERDLVDYDCVQLVYLFQLVLCLVALRFFHEALQLAQKVPKLLHVHLIREVKRLVKDRSLLSRQ